MIDGLRPIDETLDLMNMPDGDVDMDTLECCPETNVLEDFMEPLNPTDAYVFHDPLDEIMKQGVVGVYMDNDNERFGAIDEVKRPTNQYVPLTEGKFEPLLELCDTRITGDCISDLHLYYKDFVPTIRVIIDVKGFRNNVPIGGDTMTVVFVPTVEKTFRNISVTFFITSMKEISNEQVIYEGTYKCNGLFLSASDYNENPVITVPEDCEDCQISATNYCNTFEMLHEIALRRGYGLAATDECKNLNDRNIHNTKGDTYINHIENMIKYAGENEESVLDCWIDFWGYITLVNLSYIFNSEYDYRHYVMRAAVGSEFTSSNMPQQQTVLCNRVLTNFRSTSANSNIEIEHDIERISDPAALMYMGNYMTYYCMDSQDIGGVESLVPYDFETAPNDVSHKRLRQYATKPKSEMIFNNNEAYNANLQKRIRDFYITNKRSKMLKVCLKKINFALQRGTLVQVALYEDNPSQKTKMIYNIKNAIRQYENLYGEKILSIGSQTSFADEEEEKVNQEMTDMLVNDNTSEDDLTPTHLPTMETTMGDVSEREILSSHAQIPNWYESGLYYIDSMEFTYAVGEEIKQYLYLIKKDMSLKINDKYLPIHYDPDVY